MDKHTSIILNTEFYYMYHVYLTKYYFTSRYLVNRLSLAAPSCMRSRIPTVAWTAGRRRAAGRGGGPARLAGTADHK